MLRRGLDAELSAAGHAVVGPALSTGEALVLGKLMEPSLAIVDVELKVGAPEISHLVHVLNDELQVPVILMGDRAACAACTDGAAVGVLSKPIELQDVSRAVQLARQVAAGGEPDAPSIPVSLTLRK
jgi:ActR/RegA family two-component response regulator